MRWMPVAIALLLSPLGPARAQVSVGVHIGIDVPVFPELVPVPGYPVYYAPSARANYFFYDGLYWVFARDGWYASSWYDGPWNLVGPEYVPVYLLRVPVRYYRVPPPYFQAWRPDAPPRWAERYGPAWERRRVGWDRWDRRAPMRPAPLPLYQRQYAGDRYPRSFEQQRALRSENYRYRPREAVARQQYLQPGDRGGARYERGHRGPEREGGPAGPQRGGEYRQQGWHDQGPQRGGDYRQQGGRDQGPQRGGDYRQQGGRDQGPPQHMRDQPMREQPSMRGEQQPMREQGQPQQIRQPGARPEAQPQRGSAPEGQDPRRGGGRDERGDERGPPHR
jgi:hypothetical protein